MLRSALLALLMVNAGYLAWSQGWMNTLGWAPQEQSEPYRLQQQVRPDVLSIVAQPPAAAQATIAPALSPAAAAQGAAPVSTASNEAAAETALAAESSSATALASTTTAAAAAAAATNTAPTAPEPVAPEPTICLQTDQLDEAHFKKLQATLQQSDLPADSWEVLNTSINARWMVYLGKFPNDAALDKRRADLRNRKIGYDRAGGNLEPGLSLGRFSSEEAAARELGNLTKQGVKGARVVQERAAHTLYTLRFTRVTAAQQSRLQGLKSALQGKAMRTCSKP